MGLFRKALSLSTIGVVDFRSDKERTARKTAKGARYSKKAAAELRAQTALLKEQTRLMAESKAARPPPLIGGGTVNSPGRPQISPQPGGSLGVPTSGLALNPGANAEMPPAPRRLRKPSSTARQQWGSARREGRQMTETSGTDGAELADRLRQLHELHAQGALTDGEFEAAKARVLTPGPKSLSPTQWVFVGIAVFLAFTVIAIIGSVAANKYDAPPPGAPATTSPVAMGPSLPSFVGQRLDVAKASAEDAGVGVEVIGGGLFGVVEDANWTVCDQDPDPGTVSVDRVNLIVDRAC